MAREREDFYADYDPEALSQTFSVTLTQRELILIRMGLGVFLRETSRHDHVFNDLHALLGKLPPVPERRKVGVGADVPDAGLRRT